MEKIHRRDDTEALVWTRASPENNTALEVRDLDLRLRVIEVGGEERIALYAFRNDEWVLVNDWPNIFNKPSFAPSPHNLDSEHHSGKLPIAKITGHVRNNPVHVEIRLEAVLMAQSGAARTSSTAI